MTTAEPTTRRRALALVPRFRGQGYSREEVDRRRSWVEKQTGCRMEHVGSYTVAPEELRGNIENPVGTVQMPLGVAGPLRIRGLHARGELYVPLATTEGALVRSYERGMVALTRAGGAQVRVWSDENRIAPIFFFDDVGDAFDFTAELPEQLAEIRSVAEATTRHGKLLRLECHPLGRQVIVDFRFYTADAQGMNMIVRAADAACRWILEHTRARRFLTFSGFDSEKRASGSLFCGGKGKRATAGALLPREVVRRVLHTTPERLAELWRWTVMGHLEAGSLGYNGHYANGLTALFIACGQDVANVANSAVGSTCFECTPEGDLWASVNLPSLTVATVGGGTGLGTSRECLELLGCAGSGKALKLTEIVAATLLAGELSMGGALASGEFVDAHERYGRNRPEGVV